MSTIWNRETMPNTPIGGIAPSNSHLTSCLPMDLSFAQSLKPRSGLPGVQNRQSQLGTTATSSSSAGHGRTQIFTAWGQGQEKWDMNMQSFHGQKLVSFSKISQATARLAFIGPLNVQVRSSTVEKPIHGRDDKNSHLESKHTKFNCNEHHPTNMQQDGNGIVNERNQVHQELAKKKKKKRQIPCPSTIP
ncbi:hypothetical protein E2P81_ATG09573 [Venturia nashicola]|nr:hypothetical protein E2P81_ATG09573 [Venturia nashicola]